VASGIVSSFADVEKLKVVIVIWVTSNVIGDILITVSLVTYLVSVTCVLYYCMPDNGFSRQARKKTGYVATDDLVDRIIRRGILTRKVSFTPCSLLVSYRPNWNGHVGMRNAWAIYLSSCSGMSVVLFTL
jgi:hypothetical protein